MAFNTEVQETTDGSTTSFETSTSNVQYSTEKEARTPGVGTMDGDESDDVDPRKLMGKPHINEIRWLYRTSFGKTLVDKPINDAFKNGFEIRKDDPDENSKDVRDIDGVFDDTNFVPKYQLTQKKARRDGFALMFMVLEDDSEGVHVDPLDDDVNVEEIKKIQTITLDDLAKYGNKPSAPNAAIQNQVPYDNDRYEIRSTGLVVDMDPNSESYKEPLGYLIGKDEARQAKEIRFVHRNRCFHYTWNEEVDSDMGSDTLGTFEGDSVLVTIYHLLRGIKKGNWSIMQTLFRYAAKLYHVELPEDADEDDLEEAEAQLANLNAKGEVITPHGYEMEDFQTDGQLQPEEYFEVIFSQICASMEMTKSVLFGTQSGVVSGSETDIKNYFNQVQRMRGGRIERHMNEFITRYYRMFDNRTNSEEYESDFDVEWGPLFRLSDLDQAETLHRTAQTVVTATENYIMSPGEARSILQEEWAEADIEWQDEDDLEEEEREFLETIVDVTNEEEDEEGDDSGDDDDDQGSTQQQNGGGMEEGQTTASEDPTSDSLSERDVNRIAERVAEIL